MVVSLWLSVIAASNDLNLALPQAPNSAQAALPQILQVSTLPSQHVGLS